MSALFTPAPSSAAKRTQARNMELLVAGIVLILALGALLATYVSQATAAEGERIAVIARDGAVLERINLSEVDEPYTLLFSDERGSNCVLVEPGRICVSEADCPDHVCVQQGWIEDSTTPIACVPHGLTITIEVNTEADHVDALTR